LIPLPVRAAVAAAAALLAAACSAQATSAVSPSQAPLSPASRSPYQLGIDLDFYWHPDQNVPALVTQEAAYARGLGANAILISFPVYTGSAAAVAGASTPPPSALAAAVQAVRAQGLRAGVRPLLDEANLPRSRVWFLPASVTGWLASYQKVILPYAQAAQQAGASFFYTGAELSQFAHARQWRQVNAAVHTVFKGKLYFSANWTSPAEARALPASGGPGVTVAADAYPDSHASPGQFGPWWVTEAGELPRGTVLAETGIAAQAGMQQHPWDQGSPSQALDPRLQAAWFTAACEAVKADRLGGIYFWSVYVGQPLDAAPTPATATQFTDSPGAGAIQGCFTALGSAR
jgi:Glycoside Hydrolase Family 113